MAAPSSFFCSASAAPYQIVVDFTLPAVLASVGDRKPRT